VLQQAYAAFPPRTWRTPLQAVRTLAERRATFLCVPSLHRPPAAIAAGVAAAGDYIDGPYPATLEGAVRSGSGALALLGLGGTPASAAR
jgi:hydroxysqualene dehydroxylase